MIDRLSRYEAPSARERLDMLLERYNQHPVATLETYKYFNQKGKEADERKAAFIQMCLGGNTPESPDFIYDAIVIEDLIKTRDELTEMLQGLPTETELDGRGKIVRENITNRLNEIGIMLLTKMQSELSPDDESYKAVSYQLGENMREVYGVPETEHWRGVLGYKTAKVAGGEKAEKVPSEVVDARDLLK